MRSLGGFGVFIVIIAVIFGSKFYKRDNVDAKYLLEAKAFISTADKYDEFRDQFDWLVETAHADVFNDSYEMDFSRRRDRSHVNDDKYIEALFDRMFELAEGNNYYEVADSLERLIDPDAAERQAKEKAEKKKKK